MGSGSPYRGSGNRWRERNRTGHRRAVGQARGHSVHSRHRRGLDEVYERHIGPTEGMPASS